MRQQTLYRWVTTRSFNKITSCSYKNPFMTRLTRLVAPPKSHCFFTGAASIPATTTTKFLIRRAQSSLTFTPRSLLSASKFTKFTSATHTGNPLRPDAPAMDPPSSDEDFVHIENTFRNTEALSDSIVNVADELREESSNENAISGGREGEGPERTELPEELSRSVVVLNCESLADGGICDVYLIGTAHVSRESCREVQALIRHLKPEVVFLELCSSRVAVLTPQNLKVPTMGEMLEMWKKKHNMFGILYSWFLAKIANKLEVFPGSEFRVAFEEARKYGAKVILGDRPVEITLRRTWGKMPLRHKTKLLYSLLFQAFFLPNPDDLNKMLKEMDDIDMLTLVIQEMSKEFPTLMETLVHERDRYMATTLLRAAREHSLVVAVVGKGHLQGIKKHWKQPVEMKDILEIPSHKQGVSAAKVIATIGVAVGVAIISGIYFTRKK